MTKLERLKQRLKTATTVLATARRAMGKAETAVRKAFKARNTERDRLYNVAQAAREKRDKAREAITNKRKCKGAWYKVTNPYGFPIHGRRDFRYSLPKNGKMGKWHVHRGAVLLCNDGFHATKRPTSWMGSSWDNRRLFEVRVGGDSCHDNNKSVFQRLQFVREIYRGSAEFSKLTGQ